MYTHAYICTHTWCKLDKSSSVCLLSRANWTWTWPCQSAPRAKECSSAMLWAGSAFWLPTVAEPKFPSPIQPGHIALKFIKTLSESWNGRLFTAAWPVSKMLWCLLPNRERPEAPPDSLYLAHLHLALLISHFLTPIDPLTDGCLSILASLPTTHGIDPAGRVATHGLCEDTRCLINTHLKAYGCSTA
jgi:hypothetical protein